MLPIYIMLGGIVLVWTIFALPTIIEDARHRHEK